MKQYDNYTKKYKQKIMKNINIDKSMNQEDKNSYSKYEFLPVNINKTNDIFYVSKSFDR
jgi:hypothetical protein